MARVKGGPQGHLRHQESFKVEPGLQRLSSPPFPARERSHAEEHVLRHPRPSCSQTRPAPVMDRPYQCSFTVEWSDLFQVGLRNEESSDQHQPQDAGRFGRTRSTGICRSGCESKISIIYLSQASSGWMQFTSRSFFIHSTDQSDNQAGLSCPSPALT